MRTRVAAWTLIVKVAILLTWCVTNGGQAEEQVVRLQPTAVLHQPHPDVEAQMYVDLALSPDGQRLYAGANLLRKFRVDKIKTPDGLIVERSVASGPPAVLECWHIAEGGAKRLWQQGLDIQLTAGQLACSPDGKHLALGGIEEVRLLEPTSGKAVRQLKTEPPPFARLVRGLRFSPDGQFLAGLYPIGGRSGHVVHIWKVQTGEKSYLWQVEGANQDDSQRSSIVCCAFTRDGDHLILGGSYQPIIVWQPKTNQLRAWALDNELLSRTPCVHDLAVAQVRDKTYFIAAHGTLAGGAQPGDSVGVITVRDEHGKVVYSRATRGAAVALAVSPNGRWFAAAEDVCNWVVGRGPGLALRLEKISKPSAIYLWDTETGKQLAVLEGHQKGVADVVISPDGRWLASCSEDGTIRLWQIPEQLSRNP
ncbi:MAG: hypothetical protein NZM42_14010 [Gemmatales bacterium]|nr:hypothetical protein [Gemmatales bacterium]